MTAFALDTLTHRDRATILALAAELEENAIKDRTYEATPIGALVRRYLDDLYATQHFLRHKSPATTARVYVHLDVQRTVADVQKRMRDPMEVGE